jgi:hypothetical protein
MPLYCEINFYSKIRFEQKSTLLCTKFNHMQFLVLLSIVVGLMAFVFLLMGVKVFFHKSHKFPETSAGHNREMRKRGITCARQDEIKCWSKKGAKATCGTCYEHARD